MNKLLNNNLIKLINSFNNNYYTFNNVLIKSEPIITKQSINWWLINKRFAGHSKWQNIKHTKLSKDAEKSRTINKLLNKLRHSLKNVGGTDPKINKAFGEVMEMCRKANVSNITIDKAIKRALEKKAIPMKLEIMGPNGCLIVLDAESDNKSNLRYVVKTVLKKYNGFAFVDDGRAMFAFEEKAVVRVKDKDKNGQQIDLEKAEEIAIEADAEEVKFNEDNEEPILMFVSEIQNCHKIRKYIEENTNFEIIESGIELMAYNRVELPEQTLQMVVNAIEELEDLEEINRVYNNII